MTFHGVIKRIHLASNLGLKSDSLKILVTPFQNLSRQTMSVGGKQIRIREDFFDTWSEIFIESEYRCLKTLGKLKKPTYFVDCGANAGWATIWFYRMFGAVRTVAFEPIPRIFSQLVENVAGLSHVTSVNAGVSVITSSVDLYDRGAGSHLANQELWNGKVIDYGDTPPVTCKMVDFFAHFTDIDLGQNAVLKMDIEGVEHIICRDERFVRFLSRFKLVVLEVHDRDHFSIEGFMLDVVYKLEQGNWNSYIVKKSTNFSVILLTQAVANSEV